MTVAASNWLRELREAAQRPGLMNLAGMAVEARCMRELRGYFAKLREDVLKLKLEELAQSGASPETAGHAAEMRVHNVLRNLRSLLIQILGTNAYKAVLVADRIGNFAEAARTITVQVQGERLDRLGISAKEAADYAAKYSAQVVSGIDRTTQKLIADIIRRGIEEQLGVPGTGRLIRKELEDMTTRRAKMIASTEMNSAMSWSTLRKLNREGIEYKQLIVSPDEKLCDACSSIADAGPVPVNEPFVTDEGEEFDSPPIHPNCRCAVTGAHAPEEES